MRKRRADVSPAKCIREGLPGGGAGRGEERAEERRVGVFKCQRMSEQACRCREGHGQQEMENVGKEMITEGTGGRRPGREGTQQRQEGSLVGGEHIGES